MMRLTRRSLLVLAMGLAASPAALAGPGKEAAGEEKEVARSVELSGLAFPVFTRGGKLKGYLFVNARMLVAPGKDPWRYREKAHFIRDAVIRAAHRTSFNTAGDFDKLDERLAERECLKAANAILGEPDAMVNMTFTQIASQSGR